MGQGQKEDSFLGPGRKILHREKNYPQECHGGNHKTGHKALVCMGFHQHGKCHGQGGKQKTVQQNSCPEPDIPREHHPEQKSGYKNGKNDPCNKLSLPLCFGFSSWKRPSQYPAGADVSPCGAVPAWRPFQYPLIQLRSCPHMRQGFWRSLK